MGPLDSIILPQPVMSTVDRQPSLVYDNAMGTLQHHVDASVAAESCGNQY